MEDITKLLESADKYINTEEKPKYANLIDILEEDSYLDYSFKNKQFVIIKKSKMMATFDFIIQASLVLIFGILGIGLLFIL